MKQTSEADLDLKFRQLAPGILALIRRMPRILPASMRAFYTHAPIGAIIEKNAAKFPNNNAILFEEKTITYREYNESVNRYANYFLSIGVEKGDVVVVLLENRPELLTIIGALAKIGAVSSLVNPRHVGQSLIHSLNICPVRFYIVGGETINTFEEIRSQIHPPTSPDGYFCVPDKGHEQTPEGYTDLDAESSGHPGTNPPTTDHISPHDPYAYFFTSGTTGLPKGAILTHHRWTVAAHLTSALMGLGSNDTTYVSMPLCHTSAHLIGWSAAFGVGSGLAVARRFSASRFWDEIRRYDATGFLYVGEICRYLMNQPPHPDDRNNPVKRVTGNGLRPDIYRAFKRRFDIQEVYEFYGATEGTTGFFNILNVDCTLGLSLFAKEIVRFDLEKNSPVRGHDGFMVRCGKGEPGLLLGPTGGKVPFDGYTDKEASEAKVLRDVFEKGDAWFNTGDLIKSVGYGHAVFVDRIGDTFRWKSENVSTSEVEHVVNQSDDVMESIAYGVEIPLAEGRAGMVAIRARTSHESFDFESFLELLSGSLPEYAIPVFVRFMEEFETTSTHKLVKSSLKSQGFDPSVLSDPVYVLLPGSDRYVRVTDAIFDDITNGKFRF